MDGTRFVFFGIAVCSCWFALRHGDGRLVNFAVVRGRKVAGGVTATDF